MRRTAFAIPMLLLCCSCAVMNEENRHLVPWVEENLVPESTGGKILAAPVVLPVGVAAGILDAFIFHPITVIDDAYDDTADALWRDSELEYVAYCGSLPFKAAATPVVFSVDFAGRSMFAIPHRGPRRREPPKDEVAEFCKGITSGERDERIRALRTLNVNRWTRLPDKVLDGIMEACEKFEKDAGLCALAMRRLWQASGRMTPAQAGKVLDAAARFARRKEPELRANALGIVTTMAVNVQPQVATIREKAVRALMPLYDFYVKEKDYASEVACCMPMSRWWNRGNWRRQHGIVMPLHVLSSLERRGRPAYMAWVEYVFQARVLDDMPEMYAQAVKENWRAVRVRGDWPQRLFRRLEPQQPKADREQVENLAKEIIGVRAPTEQEAELLLTYPYDVLEIARKVNAKDLAPAAAAEVKALIAQLKTEIDVIELVNKLTELPKDQADAFQKSTGGTTTVTRQPIREQVR